MKVKVETRTDLQLATGRRFTVKKPGEVDLDELGYSEEEQKELTSMHWIEPLEDDEGATDAARKLAAEHEIDLAEITGTGVAGRIVKSDVAAVIAARAEENASGNEDDDASGNEDDEEGNGAESSGAEDEEDEDG